MRDARLRLLQHEDNAVYLATAETGERSVLRLAAASGWSTDELRSEVAWLDAMVGAGLPVPEPIRADDGEAVVFADGMPGMLLRWRPGRVWSRSGPTARQLALAGELVARLHAHAERFAPPPGFVRPTWDWRAIAAQLDGRLAPADRQLLDRVADRVGPLLAGLPRDRRSFGLIHSDLHRGNLLYHQRAVVAIDFDDCGWGWFAYDLATVLSSAQRFGAGPRERDACLDAYAGVRPLPPGADELATFLAMREALVMGFILTSQNPNVAAWGPARVQEALARLRAYSSV